MGVVQRERRLPSMTISRTESTASVSACAPRALPRALSKRDVCVCVCVFQGIFNNSAPNDGYIRSITMLYTFKTHFSLSCRDRTTKRSAVGLIHWPAASSVVDKIPHRHSYIARTGTLALRRLRTNRRRNHRPYALARSVVGRVHLVQQTAAADTVGGAKGVYQMNALEQQWDETIVEYFWWTSELPGSLPNSPFTTDPNNWMTSADAVNTLWKYTPEVAAIVHWHAHAGHGTCSPSPLSVSSKSRQLSQL